MLRNPIHIAPIFRRKAAALLLMTVFGIGAFATLGDGDKKSKSANTPLLTNHSITVIPGKFSLKSNYAYRGSQVINTNAPKTYISLSSTITYKQGNVTYILPMKQQVVLNKVRFNPNAQTDIRY